MTKKTETLVDAFKKSLRRFYYVILVTLIPAIYEIALLKHSLPSVLLHACFVMITASILVILINFMIIKAAGNETNQG